MAALDPRTAVFGRPLDKKAWDITARNEFLGGINQRGLRTSPRVRSALRKDHVYIAYRNKLGCSASMSTKEIAAWPARPRSIPTRRAHRHGIGGHAPAAAAPRAHVSFELPFTGVATSDDTAIEGTVASATRHARPAWIVARGDGAWLESSVEQRAGTYPMTLGFHGRDIDSGLQVTVGTRGEVSFSRAGRQPRTRTRR